MTVTVEQLAEQALSLPSEARALLAEARRRLDEIRSGAVKAVPGEETLAQVRKAFPG